MITIILAFLSTILFIVSITLLISNNRLKKKVENTIKDLSKPLRKGYIKKDLVSTNSDTDEKIQFFSYIFVKEMDRYTNGQSKIEIDEIEYGIDDAKVNHSKIEGFIRGDFKSVINPNEVIWIESENTIKEMRKAKLEVLKGIINK